MKRRTAPPRPRRTHAGSAYVPLGSLTLESEIDALFTDGQRAFLHSRELRAFGLILFALMADWKSWVARRVETVTFADPDTVRRRVSVDFTVPKLPPVLELDSPPLRFLPLALLRKRRLTNLDLRDEHGCALPLLTRRANGPLAAAALVEAALALQPNRTITDLPDGNLSQELWEIATCGRDDAHKAWRSLAQTRTGDSKVERELRTTLTRSWRFLSLANDLSRNFIVLTPLFLANNERRIIKFAYTEPAQLPRSRRRKPNVIDHLRTFMDTGHIASKDPHCMLTIHATVENGELKPMANLELALDRDDDGQSNTQLGSTDAEGRWTIQVVTGGAYKLNVATPPGLMLTGRHDQSNLEIKQSEVVSLVFRPAPSVIDHRAELTFRLKVLRWIGWSPKTIEITAPAAGQARSYHLEYVVAEGMQATSAVLRAIPTVRPLGAPAELPRPDRQAATEHRVHLYSSDAPPEYSGIAEIDLRARTSTILRGAIWVSALSLTMIALMLWRWHALGVNAIGTEVALLLAVPGGLSAYVARFQGDAFTHMVLIGLRALALSSVVWCLAAATVIVIARAVHSGSHGLHAGPAFASPYLLLGIILAGNVLSLMTLCIAWRRSSNPPETPALDDLHDTF
jgi:hypothetical protein